MTKISKMADVETGITKQQEANQAQALPTSPPPYNPVYGAADAAPPPPPSYENINDPTDAPPSYESLFGQVQAARRESSTVVEFFKKLLIIVVGTLGCTICVGLVLAIPISMIVMGSKYRLDCPVQRYIPIYLIVGGCFGVVKNLSNMCQRAKNHRENNEEGNAQTNPFDSLLNCFLTAWFIAGNVWIYQTFSIRSDEIGDPNYCNPILYYYAFWITTATYILIGTVCFCICCAGFMAAMFGKNE